MTGLNSSKIQYDLAPVTAERVLSLCSLCCLSSTVSQFTCTILVSVLLSLCLHLLHRKLVRSVTVLNMGQIGSCSRGFQEKKTILQKKASNCRMHRIYEQLGKICMNP